MNTDQTQQAEPPTVSVLLTFKERMIAAYGVIGAIQQASLTDWKTIDEILEKLGLDEGARALYVVTEKEGQINWENKEEGLKEKEYRLSPTAYEFIRKKLNDFNSKGNLSRDQRDVAKRFNVS